MTYIITTDTNADLPEEYVTEHKLELLPFNYLINEITYLPPNDLPYKEFYDRMRQSEVPKTSQVNPADAKDFFESVIDKHGVDILHIAFSSGLSGSYNNIHMAAEEVMEENPGRKIVVVDSLAASLGQGLLVHHALKLRQEGKTLEQVSKWIEDNRLNLCHYFTVDDSTYLYRGGRVSKTSQVAAGILNIKPVLHVDNEGHLVSLLNVRSRKKSLNKLADLMEKRRFPGDQDVFISHGDCIEDAQYLANQIKERFGITSILISHIGPTIGTHSGPGTVALFFLGHER